MPSICAGSVSQGKHRSARPEIKTFLSGEPLVPLSAQDATGSRMSSEAAPSTLLEAGVEARIVASGRAAAERNPLVTVNTASRGPHAECSGSVGASLSGSLS